MLPARHDDDDDDENLCCICDGTKPESNWNEKSYYIIIN